MNSCPLCLADQGQELLTRLTEAGHSITSDSKFCDSLTGNCYSCSHCGHIYNHIRGSLEKFYVDQYSLLTNDILQDQLIFIGPEKTMARSLFQSNLLHKMVKLLPASEPLSILEVGAGKGLTAKSFLDIAIQEPRQDIEYSLHEVSISKYKNFWEKINSHYSIVNRKKKYDFVASFFTLEHCEIKNIKTSYLDYVTDGGIIMLTVPNLLSNAGDLLVIDHTSHFTPDNLSSLFDNLCGNQFSYSISDSVFPRSLVILLSKSIGEEKLSYMLQSLDQHQSMTNQDLKLEKLLNDLSQSQ